MTHEQFVLGSVFIRTILFVFSPISLFVGLILEERVWIFASFWTSTLALILLMV